VIAELYVDSVLRERRDDATRTVATYNAAGQVTETRPYTTAENAAADAQIAAAAHNADLAQLRADIVTKAIVWLEADSAAAQARATAISNAVSTVQTRKSQVQGFTFNGANVSAINTQLNSGLKPLLIDMLDYIIGLGNITSGLETWRGDRVDPALVWLARHQTDTTT
jgi:hypothetical protein